MIDLSVVVPVYNGEPFIARTISELIDYATSCDEAVEIVVVDDGSTDRTAEIIEDTIANASIPVQFIRSPANEGKGAAIKRAMSEARGRFRIFLDADLAYSPQALSEVRAKLVAGSDVVIGSRVHPDSIYQVKPSFFRYLYTRHIAGRVFNWIVRWLLLPGIFDSQAGIKGFTAEAADTLFAGWLPNGFSFDLGVLSRARHEGLSIEQIPVQYRYDNEPTTVRFMSDSVAALYDLAVVRLRIGGEYSKQGLARVSSWVGRQLDDARTAMRSRHATSYGVSLIGLGLFGHAICRTTVPSNILAMAFWWIALAAVPVVAARVDRDLPTEKKPAFGDISEMGIFFLILGFAAVLRLWNLSELPPEIHGDSAESGIQGLRILLGQIDDVFGFSPWYNTPLPAHLPYTVSFGLFGTTLFALRLPSAVIGTLSVIPLYFLIRGWLGPRAAQIATIFFALSHSAIHFSRIGLWNIQALFLELVAFAFLAAALRKGSAVLAAIAGIIAGLGFYTYTGGRLIMVVALAVLALQLMLGPRRRWLPVAGFVVAGFAVAITPLLISYIEEPTVLGADRTGSVLALAEANRHHVSASAGESSTFGILRVHTVLTLRGFFNHGDRSGQYATDLAIASPTIAVLALVGVLIALARFRETGSRLVLLWTFLGLVLGSILIMDPPSSTRLIMVFPTPFIFAALTLETTFRWMGRRGGRLAAVLIAAACILIIGQAAVFNLGGYHRHVRHRYLEAKVWDVVNVIERYGKNYDYYFFGGPTMLGDSPPLRLFGAHQRIVTGITPKDVPEALSRDAVFIIPYSIERIEKQLSHVSTVITERYPEAERLVSGGEGNPQLVLYIVSVTREPVASGGQGVLESN
jgi:glycosyltransferase involved in cell wall biosynthesis/4-amino-4-deoxy-L-arabinose transferase-like glycosyltransferase